MKQIELKHVVSDDRTIVLDYRETILAISRNHPEGIKVADMEKAVRVISAVKKANGVLRLEDADWETLKTYVSVYPFAFADEVLIQFKLDIDHASEVEV